jgi:hypothetical protein
MAFNYYRSITIDHTKCGSSDSSAFPVLVSLSDNTLKTVGNGGHVQNSNGYDIYFYSDSSLTTRLPAERETYDASAGTYVGWVKVNVTYASDKVIYIAYGDSGISTDPNADGTYGKTSTWNSDYKAVWHLPDGTTLNANDSTGVNNGTISGPTATTGQIDGGASYSSSTDNIACGTDSSLDIAGPITVSNWGYRTGGDTRGRIINRIASSKGYILFYANVDVTNGVAFGINDSSSLTHSLVEAGDVVTNNAWYYIVATYDNNGHPHLYVNGSEVTITYGSMTQTLLASGTTAYLGWRPGNDRTFAGVLDEVRVSSVVRSADWILTEYNNQNDPGNIGTPGFYTVGSEQGGATVYTYSGIVNLTLLPSAIRYLLRIYSGLANITLTPSSIRNLIRAYNGQLNFILLPNSAYELVSVTVYSYNGLTNLTLLPSSLRNFVRNYSGQLNIILTPNSAYQLISTFFEYNGQLYIALTPSAAYQLIHDRIIYLGNISLILLPKSEYEGTKVITRRKGHPAPRPYTNINILRALRETRPKY